MAYFDGTNWILEKSDWRYTGKTHAEHGSANMSASVPAAHQTAYDEGWNDGLHFKKYLNILVP